MKMRRTKHGRRSAPDLPIAFVGTYPPRLCGIATFTRDLSDAVIAADRRVQATVLAVTDAHCSYEYPERVRFEIRRGIKGDYTRAAEFVNRSDIRLVSIQHEYGIFGGDNGAYILDFLSHLRKRAKPVLRPRHAQPIRPWELIQIGNCGSPIETEAGWLVLTHGVGPMRCYVIGALLLDLEDPSHVIAHLPDPLLVPEKDEREGYVPNVLYSCGGMVHRDNLVIPYAFSDVGIKVALVQLPDLLDQLNEHRCDG